MVIIRAFKALQEMKVVAITREHVLQALSTVTVDSAGTSLAASGRLSEVVIDQNGRVM